MQELDKYMLFASTKKRSAYPERPDDDAVERKNVQSFEAETNGSQLVGGCGTSLRFLELGKEESKV